MRDLYKEAGNPLTIVSKDEIRLRLHGGQWHKDTEPLVLIERDNLITAAMSRDEDIIVDDTNLHPKHEKRIRELVNEIDPEYQVIVKTFEAEFDELVRRDTLRCGLKRVGKRVIERMWFQMYGTHPGVKVPIPRPPYRSGYDRCVIVDIDGTLAVNDGHRSPYDYSRVIDDKVNEPVKMVVRYLSANIPIVVMSGRDSDCRLETQTWLLRNGIPFNHLFMRETGDRRPDDIVKQELLETLVLPKYDVELVLDDRDRVVKMWRGLGFPCFQVNYGDF